MKNNYKKLCTLYFKAHNFFTLFHKSFFTTDIPVKVF